MYFPGEKNVVTFQPGSLIVPMDVDFQDAGMLKAFGLVDKLLRSGVTINWCIRLGKQVVDTAKGRFEPDFRTASKDLVTNAAIREIGLMQDHDYRGG